MFRMWFVEWVEWKEKARRMYMEEKGVWGFVRMWACGDEMREGGCRVSNHVGEMMDGGGRFLRFRVVLGFCLVFCEGELS